MALPNDLESFMIPRGSIVHSFAILPSNKKLASLVAPKKVNFLFGKDDCTSIFYKIYFVNGVSRFPFYCGSFWKQMMMQKLEIGPSKM